MPSKVPAAAVALDRYAALDGDRRSTKVSGSAGKGGWNDPRGQAAEACAMIETGPDRPQVNDPAEMPEGASARGSAWLPALLGVLVTLLLVSLLFGLAFLKAGLF